jgi:uncharacterized protein YecE (DUF72 family)
VLTLDLSALPERLHLGTSSFSWDDWRGNFYPEGLEPADYLGFYATVFPTVEIDATWYHAPSRRTVESWARKVPERFVFSLKVPREITHERYLEGCRDEWNAFLNVLEPLGEKRGPLLFQFPYVAKGKDADEYATGDDFRRRLRAFLPLLPEGGRYAVEVRNARWLRPPLTDLLRTRGIALALVSYYTLPGPAEWLRAVDPVTAPFSYLRFLGHREAMDKLVAAASAERGKTRDWDELLADRERETRGWMDVACRLLERGQHVFVYFNNHFAGYAPGSVDLFLKLWGDLTPPRTTPAPS